MQDDYSPRIAAIYCRLSKDDEKIGESVSIETQKMMLCRQPSEAAAEDIIAGQGKT